MLRLLRTAAALGCFAVSLVAMSPSVSSAQEVTFMSAAISQEWSPYMTPEAIHAERAANPNVQIIDIRAEKYVSKGVIPGAVSIPFAAWRGVDDKPGQPIHADDLATLLGDAGIRLDQPIVVHHRAGKTIQNGRAAIVYWILKSAGAQDIAIMNGGIKAWRAADLGEADAPADLPPVALDITYNTAWWADPLDIFAVTTNQKDGAILDARLDGQVRKAVETGEPMMSMPMARFVPASFFTQHLTARNMTAPAQAEFYAELEARGLDIGVGMLISVCQTGELSALSWFYASEIVGIENVRYYPDALRGWEADGGIMFGLQASL